jgi:hypothetical protein
VDAAQTAGNALGWEARNRPPVVGGERIELPTSSV